jgi:LDH2 family malate/lactate/ureidoglycolate dehydrogenase
MDILAGALSGAGCSGSSDAVSMQGLFVSVTNIASFTTPDEFREQVQGLVRFVKSSINAMTWVQLGSIRGGVVISAVAY